MIDIDRGARSENAGINLFDSADVWCTLLFETKLRENVLRRF
jgi:hypothetical protein